MFDKELKTGRRGEVVVYNKKHHHYHLKGRRGRNFWTILTKDSTCKRGDYAEEFDVVADGEAEAKRIAQTVLNEWFDPDLRISRALWLGRV